VNEKHRTLGFYHFTQWSHVRKLADERHADEIAILVRNAGFSQGGDRLGCRQLIEYTLAFRYGSQQHQ